MIILSPDMFPDVLLSKKERDKSSHNLRDVSSSVTEPRTAAIVQGINHNVLRSLRNILQLLTKYAAIKDM